MICYWSLSSFSYGFRADCYSHCCFSPSFLLEVVEVVVLVVCHDDGDSGHGAGAVAIAVRYWLDTKESCQQLGSRTMNAHATGEWS
jgi:hypothetical protein